MDTRRLEKEISQRNAEQYAYGQMAESSIRQRDGVALQAELGNVKQTVPVPIPVPGNPQQGQQQQAPQVQQAPQSPQQ
jgi:hypothetical protein